MNFTKYKNRLYLLVHIIAWAIVFAFPLLFIRKDNVDGSLISFLRYCVVPSAFLIIFYTNYFYLIDKFLFQKKIRTFIFTNLLLVIIIGILMHISHELMFSEHKGKFMHQKELMNILFTLRNMVSLIFTVIICVAIKGSFYWYHTEEQRKELERQRTEAELKNLKSQLNPHFLFNTLNNIYALIAISQEKSQQAVLELSKMLRYVLYDDNMHSVPLQKEVDFINNYIALMQLRLPENMQVNKDIDISRNPQMELAPLLFISLIENAFKHGTSPDKDSFVNIKLKVEEGDQIVCELENSYFPKSKEDKSGSGIGLENLKRRLELLYPNNHTFTTGVKNDRFFAKLTIKPTPSNGIQG
ncbi:MAG TPA: histidine kinase [Paludibacteraceae bacterium]|nr:histidine kinase [Paludibacteraceae bacterium]